MASDRAQLIELVSRWQVTRHRYDAGGHATPSEAFAQSRRLAILDEELLAVDVAALGAEAEPRGLKAFRAWLLSELHEARNQEVVVAQSPVGYGWSHLVARVHDLAEVGRALDRFMPPAPVSEERNEP